MNVLDAYPADFIGARTFYGSDAAYAEFDVDGRGRTRESCIDPRNTGQEELNVDIQTPGGLPGRATDRAVADIAMAGSIGGLTETLIAEARATPERVAGAHFDTCKFVVGLRTVLDIMADPDAAALKAIEDYAIHYEVPEGAVESARHAAGILLERFEPVDTTGWAEVVDGLHPTSHNVPRMVSPNTAGFYIVNHTTGLGLNRYSVLRGAAPPAYGAYHDSLGANIARLGHVEAGGPRQLRVAAIILRTAATRTAVAADLSHLDVFTETEESENRVRVVESGGH